MISLRTRRALDARLEPPPSADLALEEALVPLVECVVPAERPSSRELARRLSADLLANRGDGWRYAELPADEAAWRRGLARLDVHAAARGSASFAALDPDAREALLTAVQAGELEDDFPITRWFEDVRGRLVVLFASDPRTLERMGFDGWRDEGFAESELGRVAR